MTKPTLMLLPGLLCDETVWRDQEAFLSDRFVCVVPDYRACTSIRTMADQVLRKAPTERFGVIGHSMGGRVALEVLRLAPERVSRLGLLDSGIDPRPDGATGVHEADKRAALVAMAKKEGMRAMGEQWAMGMVHPTHVGTDIFEDILAMIERTPVDAYEGQIRALLDRPDARPVLTAAKCPTLLMCGRQDNWSPLERHVEMQNLLPLSRLVVIEHSGHMTTMEQPDEVNAGLADWLNQHNDSSEDPDA